MFRFFYLIVAGFTYLSCANSQEKGPIAEVASRDRSGIKDSTINIKNNDGSYKDCKWVKDTLTVEEKAVLNHFAEENEFLFIINQVERLLISGNDKPLLSRLSIPEDLLLKKGYLFYEFKSYGKFTDVNISYTYNMGQASNGIGSIIGTNTSNYIHTLQSCGISKCITRVFQNGKMILDK